MDEDEIERLADKVAERMLPAILKALSVPKAAKRTFAQVDSGEPLTQPGLSAAQAAATARYWLEKRGRI